MFCCGGKYCCLIDDVVFGTGEFDGNPLAKPVFGGAAAVVVFGGKYRFIESIGKFGAAVVGDENEFDCCGGGG